ncbi:hypothetical protein BGX28_008853 [Mortierella sp. GBA30]|nr:hypothetical protein BGX28_008853 [Mortierella sp. GBA30]
MVDGESTSFPVDASATDTVGDLKDRIKAKKAPRFDDVAADELTLWKVSIPSNKAKEVLFKTLDAKEELDPTYELSDVFEEGEEWRERVSKIEGGFFAPESVNYTSLVQLLKAGVHVPTTRGTLGGLPFILPRAGKTTVNRPNLLFLNLPESPETQDPLSTAARCSRGFVDSRFHCYHSSVFLGAEKRERLSRFSPRTGASISTEVARIGVPATFFAFLNSSKKGSDTKIVI